MRCWPLGIVLLLLPGILPLAEADGAPDLAVLLVVPEDVGWRQTTPITVRVENWGEATADAYHVRVLDGNAELARFNGTNLAPGGVEERTVEWVPEHPEHALLTLVDGPAGDADSHNDRFELRVTVPDAPRPSVRIERLERRGELEAVQGEPVGYRVRVQNLGNETVDVRLSVRVDDTPVHDLELPALEANATGEIDGNWTPAEPGRYELSVRLIEPAGSGFDGERAIQVAVAERAPAPPPAGNASTPPPEEPVAPPPKAARPVLVLNAFEAATARGRPGAFVFRVTLENQGDATAHDVQVRFLVDDEPASDVTIPVLAPGLGVTVASRAWTGPPGAHEARVGILEADGDALVIASAPDGATLEVLVPRAEAHGREVPALALLPLLIGLGCVTLHRACRGPTRQQS